MDKPRNDLSRAWNGISRAWTGVPGFSINLIFMLQQNFGSRHPKKVNNLGINLDTLDGTRIQKTYRFKTLISLVLVRVFCCAFKLLGSDLYLLGSLTFRGHIVPRYPKGP